MVNTENGAAPVYEYTSESKAFRLIGLVTVSASLLALHIGVLPFLRRFSGAPYVSSSVKARSVISEALQRRAAAKARDGLPLPQMIDMGSGSGEIVVDAARAGFAATGYELNTWLIIMSRWRAWKAKLPHAQFIRGDMWSASLRDADVVVVFGIPDIMDRVRAKVAAECAPGCLVCCNSFPIKEWRPVQKKAGVWFYDVGNVGNVGKVEADLTRYRGDCSV